MNARERALELLAQVDETLDRAAVAAAGRNDVHVPAADWRGCRSTSEMSQAQFSAWLAAGKPSLREQQPSKERRREAKDQMTEAIATRALLRREMQQHVQQRLEQFAALMGEEVANVTAALRSEITQLKAELASRDADDPPRIKLIGGGRNG